MSRHQKYVAFHTLGCKVNQYDTQAMRQAFEDNGYEVVGFDQQADVYVINTCTVTALADRKSRQTIRKAVKNNPNARVVATGCYTQREPEKVQQIEGVDLIIGTDQRHKIVELIDKRNKNAVVDINKVSTFEEMALSTFTDRTRAVLKIQEGCNQFCSYCIIPYVRGRVRSRKELNIIDEVRTLAESGIKEFVLTGIHVSSYGEDLVESNAGEPPLIHLIKEINRIDGVERIRLGSLEPKVMTKPFVEFLASCNKLCHQFHLSLQSGSDSVLKRMNRHYSTKEYLGIVEIIREHMPLAAITTDIIVGFPGETEDEFKQTLDFVKQINFAKVHVFPYSIREGTKAANMDHHLTGDVKAQRAKELGKLVIHQEKNYVKQFLGKTLEIIVEEPYNQEYMCGYTPHYVRVACRGEFIQGQLLKVKANEIEGTVLLGVLSE